MKTVLAALDSQYIHTNLAVRSLAAGCPPELAPVVREYNINQQLPLILKDLLSLQPEVVCFSCYIWNIQQVLRLCGDLKMVCPGVTIVLGGPEVSFTSQEVLAQHPCVDIVFCGEGEEGFPALLHCLARQMEPALPGVRYRRNGTVLGDGSYQLVQDLSSLPFPYAAGLTEADRNKILYYESTRGCPFSCAYCLSGSMGGGLRELPLERVKQELIQLCRWGVPLIKFVDRTFNADKPRAKALIRFLLEETGDTRFHFEVGADLLDEELLELFRRAPRGKLQLEAGVQSCNPDTLRAVVRRTDLERLERNVTALMDMDTVHVHLDLIAGLPGESLESFGRSFDRVYRLQPHQLQLGFLKLLKGSALWKRAEREGIRCRRYPPYEVLSTPVLSAEELLALKGVEEVLERYYNSGRARRGMRYLIQKGFCSPFACYAALYRFCDERGCIDRPMGAGAQFEVLGEFAAEKLTRQGYLECLALLKIDWLLSGAKGAVPQLFSPIRTQRCIHDWVRKAKKEGKITEYQTRHAKFDVLPMHPLTGDSTECFVMVENSMRDAVAGEGKMTVLYLLP